MKPRTLIIIWLIALVSIVVSGVSSFLSFEIGRQVAASIAEGYASRQTTAEVPDNAKPQAGYEVRDRTLVYVDKSGAGETIVPDLAEALPGVANLDRYRFEVLQGGNKVFVYADDPTEGGTNYIWRFESRDKSFIALKHSFGAYPIVSPDEHKAVWLGRPDAKNEVRALEIFDLAKDEVHETGQLTADFSYTKGVDMLGQPYGDLEWQSDNEVLVKVFLTKPPVGQDSPDQRLPILEKILR